MVEQMPRIIDSAVMVSRLCVSRPFECLSKAAVADWKKCLDFCVTGDSSEVYVARGRKKGLVVHASTIGVSVSNNF